MASRKMMENAHAVVDKAVEMRVAVVSAARDAKWAGAGKVRLAAYGNLVRRATALERDAYKSHDMALRGELSAQGINSTIRLYVKAAKKHRKAGYIALYAFSRASELKAERQDLKEAIGLDMGTRAATVWGKRIREIDKKLLKLESKCGNLSEVVRH
ncbi:MAG: hypothetical protein KGH64_05770 [Candidatus Micrarchaeota archaeon]|nr:hypothetical protein [Candidatus Micrarchaeota archaeon]MDE1834814.1 hypothetical protein [Candidatus Micrarchaeota archaeon]MDE1859861.1 hypothetical protein [Candidatus Micrarchaeota archaeon]